ncbi:MAG: hypothetical protein QW168_05700 [Sulfolobales archaeon]
MLLYPHVEAQLSYRFASANVIALSLFPVSAFSLSVLVKGVVRFLSS